MNTPSIMLLALATTVGALSGAALAQSKPDDHAAHHASASSTPVAADMTDAEVRKVDVEGGKLTLRHGEIRSLQMPPMTMVFSVKDKAVLGKVRAGDKVRFRAVNEAGRYTVTDLQVVP